MPDLFMSNDPDAMTEEEKAAAEAEARGEAPAGPTAEEQEAERLRLEEEEKAKLAAEQKPEVEHREPPERNWKGEQARLRDDLKASRARIAEREQELERLREENLRFKARQEIEREAADKIKQVAQKTDRPDESEDPYGARLWDLQKQNQDLAAWKQKQEEKEQQAEAQRQQQEAQTKYLTELDQFLAEDVQQFKADNPDVDYNSAAQWVQKALVNMYKHAGKSDQDALAFTALDFARIGDISRQSKKSVAEAVYGMASDLGWKAGANNGTAEAVNNNKSGPTAKEKIALVKKGQSLQGIGGKTPAERNPEESIMSMSAEEIANLPDDLFLAWKQDPKLGKLLDQRLEELGTVLLIIGGTLMATIGAMGSIFV